jgi:predicted RNase H-like HicB family nuclease
LHKRSGIGGDKVKRFDRAFGRCYYGFVKTLFDYQVVCRRDDNGSYVAYVPAIEGCHAIGRTPEEAQHELNDVFDMIAEEFAAKNQPLPDDVQLTVAHAR